MLDHRTGFVWLKDRWLNVRHIVSWKPINESEATIKFSDGTEHTVTRDELDKLLRLFEPPTPKPGNP